MKRPTKALLIPAILLGLATAGLARQEVPDIFMSTNPVREEPIWVSARTALSPSGEVNREYFPEYAENKIRYHLEAGRKSVNEQKKAGKPVDPCGIYVSGTPEYQAPKPARSLDDLIEHSKAIYRGRIVGADIGFLDGLPGKLLRVEIERAYRSSADYAAEQPLFLVHPSARVKVQGQLFCTPHRSYDPKVGDRVLLFGYYPALDPGRSLLAPAVEHVIYESAEGKLHIPERLRNDGSLTGLASLESLETILRTRLDELR